RARSGLRPGDRYAGSGRADVLRGARAGAGARRPVTCRRRHRRGLAAVRRAWADHRAHGRQSALRARESPGAAEMMERRQGFAPGVWLLVVLAALLVPAVASAAPQPVATIEIEGVINPVTLRLVGIAIDRAQAERAQALIIQLDTPGGLE